MRRNDPLPKRECLTCKKDYIPKKITSKNCSSVCMTIHTRNKILARTQDRSDRISGRLEVTPKKPCKTCGKLFAPISKTRINCSHKCAISYNYYKRNKKKENPQECGFKKFAIGTGKDIPKDILRNEVESATAMFLKRGGTIQKIAPVISPKIPSVGSVEWSWVDQAGIGPFSDAENYTDPEYILDEILLLGVVDNHLL